jgi:catechol 2,3-dioxygenase-like lactoylglutathione lyase family enzyme
MLKRVDRVLLRVPQLESAVKYYRDVLGLKPSAKKSATVASFKLDEHGTELVLHADPDLPAEATYFLVEDVRDLYNRRAELQLKFASAPAPVSRGYRATVKDPFGNVLLILDRTAERGGGGGGGGAGGAGGAGIIEDAKPAGSGALFAGVEPKIAAKKNVLATIYQNIARTADDPPYTPHFESLYASYTKQLGDPKPTRQEVWRHLLNMRKAGDLPKLGPAKSKPPKLDKQEESRLRDLLGDAIGKRDRLPYTPRFDQLVTDFNRPLTKKLSPHLVWRIVAKLAK